MSKQVIINQADLDKLEESRCALFDFLEDKGLTKDSSKALFENYYNTWDYMLTLKEPMEYLPYLNKYRNQSKYIECLLDL